MAENQKPPAAPESKTLAKSGRQRMLSDFVEWIWHHLCPIFGLCQAFYANTKVDVPKRDALLTFWGDKLSSAKENSERANAISRSYDGAIIRDGRLEAKAVGSLQIIAIVVAVVAIVLLRDAIFLRILSLLSLIFLFTAIWGVFEVLRVVPRPQLLVKDSLSASDGLVESAASAEELQFLGIKTANFMWGVARDLRVAGAFAILALVLMVFGLGSPQNDLPPSKQIPAYSIPSPTIANNSVTSSGPLQP